MSVKLLEYLHANYVRPGVVRKKYSILQSLFGIMGDKFIIQNGLKGNNKARQELALRVNLKVGDINI